GSKQGVSAFRMSRDDDCSAALLSRLHTRLLPNGGRAVRQSLARVAAASDLALLPMLRAEERRSCRPPSDGHRPPTAILVAARGAFYPVLDGGAVLADDHRPLPRHRPAPAGCTNSHGPAPTPARRPGARWLALRGRSPRRT